MQKRRTPLLLLTLFTVLILCCQHLTGNAEEKPYTCPATGELDLSAQLVCDDVPEPSGIVYHPGRAALFVVGDQGDIGKMQVNGVLMQSRHLGEYDFEGITVDPATGLLYAVVENAGTILEIHPETLNILHEFSIDWNNIDLHVFDPMQEHFEGITFVRDSTHTVGGWFIAVNRSETPEKSESPSALVTIELPLHSDNNSEAAGLVTNIVSLQIPGLSGIQYLEETKELFLVSDQENSAFRVTMSGKILECFSLRGKKQEGITFDTDSRWYIPDDAKNAIFVYQ